MSPHHDRFLPYSPLQSQGLQHKTSKNNIVQRNLKFLLLPPSPNGATASGGPRSPHYRGLTITLRHTTLGRTPLDEGSARRRDLYLTTHNIHNRQTSMPPGRIRTAIPASERPQTHTLHRAATGIGQLQLLRPHMHHVKRAGATTTRLTTYCKYHVNKIHNIFVLILVEIKQSHIKISVLLCLICYGRFGKAYRSHPPVSRRRPGHLDPSKIRQLCI